MLKLQKPLAILTQPAQLEIFCTKIKMAIFTHAIESSMQAVGYLVIMSSAASKPKLKGSNKIEVKDGRVDLSRYQLLELKP